MDEKLNCREKLLSYLSQRNRGWLFTLFAVVCIVYLPFLGNPFVFDDLNFFQADSVEHFAHFPFQLELRWLPYASLSWTYSIFSDVLPHPYHLGNVLLHSANVILLFFLLRQLVNTGIPDDSKSPSAIWGAGFGALIFACHPVVVYAVGYVIERSILMAALFSLLAQLAYLRGLLTGEKRWLLITVCAYFMACLSKEHSVMTLALLAAQTIYVRAKIIAGKGALWATWISLFAIALMLIILLMRAKGELGITYEPMASNSFGQHGIVESSAMLHGLSALTQAGLFFKYLLLWSIPNPAWMSVDMREYFVPTWLAWQGWLGAVGFVAYGALGFWLLLRPRWQGLAGLALLYPWLQFVVEFSAIRVQEPFVLYRSYLWMPGLMLFFPLILEKLPNHRNKTQLVMGVVVLLLIPLAWNRLWVFADSYRLWNDAVLLLNNGSEAGADRIFYNRGNAELSEQKWEAASEDFLRAVSLSPQLAPIHYGLGIAYMNTRRNQDALKQFDMAITLKPDDASYYYAKGMSLKRLHQDDLAMRQMEKSCELKNVMACMIVQSKTSKK